MLSCLLILYFMGVVRCLSMSWCAVMCANTRKMVPITGRASSLPEIILYVR